MDENEYEYGISSSPRTRWKVGDKLEAKDFMNVWYPSKVVGCDEQEDAILVHFEGWNQRYDEWFPRNSNKIRPLADQHKYFKETPKFASSVKLLKVGQYVLAPWKDGDTYPGRINYINHKQKKYDISFLDGATRSVSFRKVFVMSDEEVQEMHQNMGNSDEISTSTDTNSTIEVEQGLLSLQSNFFRCTEGSCLKIFRNRAQLKTHMKQFHCDEETYEGPQRKIARVQRISTCSGSSYISVGGVSDQVDLESNVEVCSLCDKEGSFLQCESCLQSCCQNCLDLLQPIMGSDDHFRCFHCFVANGYKPRIDLSHSQMFLSKKCLEVIDNLTDLQKLLKNSSREINRIRSGNEQTNNYEGNNKLHPKCIEIDKELDFIEITLDAVEQQLNDLSEDGETL